MKKIIKTAFIITVSAMLLFFIFIPLMKNGLFLLSTCCCFYTLSNAFLTSSIFSLFSKEREIHQQGKGFGLIVAADSAGFLVGVIAEKGFENFQIAIEYAILVSLLVFLISWFPYSAYEKGRKNANRVHND